MRLLLAEDERDLSRALTAVLRHNNYSVDAVFDGQDALDYLENGSYDGAVLDIMMPKLDGITVLQRVRAEGNQIPILLLTAKSEIEDRVNGLDSGADDYLVKPFSMKELLARIRAMTRRQGDLSNSVLSVGDIRLDRSSYQISCGEKSLRLTSKEYQMLEMLMLHPGQIITVEQFMERIWGYDSDTDSTVIWTYISKLRRILTQLGSSVKLRSTRGLGYSMEAAHD